MTITMYIPGLLGFIPAALGNTIRGSVSIGCINIVKYRGPLETYLLKTGKANGTLTFMQSSGLQPTQKYPASLVLSH